MPGKPFRQLTKKEAKIYYEWFLKEIPERTRILTTYVNHFSGYESWTPDHNPSSLTSLGAWFGQQVEIRLLTEDEERIAQECSTHPEFGTPEYRLTGMTLSLVMDVSIYVSQVLLKNKQNIYWQLSVKGGRTDIDYNQPVLEGFISPAPFNPFHAVRILALKIVSGERSGKDLRALFDRWASRLPTVH